MENQKQDILEEQKEKLEKEYKEKKLYGKLIIVFKAGEISHLEQTITYN